MFYWLCQLGFLHSRHQAKISCAKEVLGQHLWGIKGRGTRVGRERFETTKQLRHLWKERGKERRLGRKSPRLPLYSSEKVLARWLGRPGQRLPTRGICRKQKWPGYSTPLRLVIGWETSGEENGLSGNAADLEVQWLAGSCQPATVHTLIEGRAEWHTSTVKSKWQEQEEKKPRPGGHMENRMGAYQGA